MTGSSQEGLGLLLATVANETVWQNCHGELSLQVTGDPPTTDVLPAGAQAGSGLCRCCASWCWSVRGSGLRGDQLGCRSVKLWGSQAVVSQVAGPWAATARLRGGQATVSPPGPGSVCHCHGSLAAGQAGFPVAEPRARAGARTMVPIPSPVSFVGHALQRHVEAVLVVEAVPADGPRLAVGAHQELDVAHVAGEAHILEGEHVAHQPVLPHHVPAAAARCGRRLLPHGGQEELRETQRHRPARRGRPSPQLPARPPPLPHTTPPHAPHRAPVPHGGRRWRRRAAAPATRSAGTAPPSGCGPARTPARPSPARRREEEEREEAPPPAPSLRRPPPWPRRRAECRHRPRGGAGVVTRLFYMGHLLLKSQSRKTTTERS